MSGWLTLDRRFESFFEEDLLSEILRMDSIPAYTVVVWPTVNIQPSLYGSPNNQNNWIPTPHSTLSFEDLSPCENPLHSLCCHPFFYLPFCPHPTPVFAQPAFWVSVYLSLSFSMPLIIWQLFAISRRSCKTLLLMIVIKKFLIEMSIWKNISGPTCRDFC